MANNENLKPVSSESEAREKGRKGGVASGKARAKKKKMKEELLLLLAQGETKKNIVVALVDKALAGDTRAFLIIREWIDEKPIEWD